MSKILVVDDEPDIVRFVVQILEARGHLVSTAKDGPEALAAVAADRPDVLVIDFNLPEMDGAEVCRRLRSAESTRSIPVVMITGEYLSLEHLAEGGYGADEYVVKPFLSDLLVSNVERLLAQRDSSRPRLS